jgi:hypothetical protein
MSRRIVPFKEAIALDYGEKIPSLRAKIKSVVQPSTGTNDHGDWTIQNVTVEDPADPKATIKLKLFDQPEIEQNWKGKVVLIESGTDKKGGICDVTLMQDTYKWKQGQPEKRMIEVRKEATINLDQGRQQEEEPKQPPQQRQQTQQRPNSEPTASEPASTKGAAPAPETQASDRAATTTHEPPKKKTREELIAEDREKKRKAIKEAAKYCARRTNAFRIILKSLDKLAEERQAINRPLSDSQFQGLLAQIYIGGDRTAYGGTWADLPTTKQELEELWPQQKASPAPEDNGND